MQLVYSNYNEFEPSTFELIIFILPLGYSEHSIMNQMNSMITLLLTSMTNYGIQSNYTNHHCMVSLNVVTVLGSDLHCNKCQRMPLIIEQYCILVLVAMGGGYRGATVVPPSTSEPIILIVSSAFTAPAIIVYIPCGELHTIQFVMWRKWISCSSTISWYG